MTYTVELEPEIAQRFEEQAAQNGTTPQEMFEKWLKSKFDGERRERLMKMANELFDERASAYEALAEGAK